MLPAGESAAGGRSVRRAPVLAALVSVLLAGAAVADEWLVYIGAGLEAIEGGWEERRGQVLFRLRGGTLVSVPYADVDLPTSAIVTWQLGGRRRVPPRAPLPNGPAADAVPAPPCTAARVVSLRSGETLEVTDGKRRELIHLACLDTPETQHKYPELGWFGRAALSAVELEVPAGAHVCIAEQTPPQRDGEGHRIVFVTLADGRDYAAEVIGGGLGLLRPAGCARAAYYRRLEDRAIGRQRGLWGEVELAAGVSGRQPGGVGGRRPAVPQAIRRRRPRLTDTLRARAALWRIRRDAGRLSVADHHASSGPGERWLRFRGSAILLGRTDPAAGLGRKAGQLAGPSWNVERCSAQRPGARRIALQGRRRWRRQADIFGWAEPVVLEETGFELEAKLDTGAETSSLDAIDIRRFRRGKDGSRFTVEDHAEGDEVQLERPCCAGCASSATTAPRSCARSCRSPSALASIGARWSSA